MGIVDRANTAISLVRHGGPTALVDKIRDRSSLRFRDRGSTYSIPNDASAAYHIEHSTQKLRRLAAHVPVTASIVVDVGAHSGLFGRFAAERAPDATVVFIEPDITLAPIIEANAASIDRWVLLRTALGSEEGEGVLYRNRRSTQTNALDERSVRPFGDEDDIESIDIRVTTLDAVWTDHLSSGPIDVLKIDVQGFEHAVLAGGSRALEHVETLLIEVSVLDSRAPDVLAALSEEFGAPETVNLVAGGADLAFSRRSPE